MTWLIRSLGASIRVSSRVARLPPFWPDLAPVTTPSGRLPRRSRGCQGGFDLWKSRASFLAVVKAGFLKVAAQTEQILEMGGWEVLQIEELHFICCRVVLPRNEIGVLGNGEALVGQLLPHPGFVGHGR